jgi:hypothetical protein
MDWIVDFVRKLDVQSPNLSGRYRYVSQRMTIIKEERKLFMKEVCCQSNARQKVHIHVGWLAQYV